MKTFINHLKAIGVLLCFVGFLSLLSFIIHAFYLGIIFVFLLALVGLYVGIYNAFSQK